MPPQPPKTSVSSHHIRASNLTPESFTPFGTVIQNPRTHANQPLHLQHVEANQGTATKWLDVTHLRSFYEQAAASRRRAGVSFNMFVCRPRELRRGTSSSGGKGGGEGQLFDVKILERHPFTAQTFVPMGLAAGDRTTQYLVIVAPTLALKTRGRGELSDPPYPTQPAPRTPRRRRRSLRERLLGARPNPFTNDFTARTTPPTASGAQATNPKGPGMPDLSRLRAFVATGDQAVTYGPGTWHAPMVVLGEREVEFVVVQFANGVAVEDCQEVEVVAEDGGDGVAVEVGDVTDEGKIKARL